MDDDPSAFLFKKTFVPSINSKHLIMNGRKLSTASFLTTFLSNLLENNVCC
jgi:hypothetical protein